MKKFRRKLIHVVTDILLFLTVMILALLLAFNKVPSLAPFKRGFFCDDQTLMYPYHDDTVRASSLALATILLFPAVVIIWEQIHLCCYRGRLCSTLYVMSLYYAIGNFLLGGALTLLTVEILKLCAGRLRPHFFDVCQPVVTKGNNCSMTPNGYIAPDAFTCSGNNMDALEDVRKSFPSGHAAAAVYFLVYIFLYLDVRMRLRFQGYFRVLAPILQSVCLVYAVYVCISRLQDNKHHVTDVIGGGIIGLLGCLLTMFRLSAKMPDKFLQLKSIHRGTGCAGDEAPPSHDNKGFRPDSVCTDTSGPISTIIIDSENTDYYVQKPNPTVGGIVAEKTGRTMEGEHRNDNTAMKTDDSRQGTVAQIEVVSQPDVASFPVLTNVQTNAEDIRL